MQQELSVLSSANTTGLEHHVPLHSIGPVIIYLDVDMGNGDSMCLGRRRTEG